MKLTKTLLYAIIFASAGILTFCIVFYSQHRVRRIHEKNIAYAKLPSHVRQRTTAAHLWFEELLAGDKNANFEAQVLQPLATSQGLLDAAYHGRETSLANFPQTTNEDTKALLKTASIDLERLISSAERLWEKHNTAQTDSLREALASGEEEQSFDAEFAKFQGTMDQLERHINGVVDSGTRDASVLSWVAVVIVFLSFGILSTLVHRFQSVNEKRVFEQEQRLTEEAKRVSTLSQFIEAVSAGNYDLELQANANDGLTGKLIAMRDKLKQNAEEERKRNWSTTALAQIGEILRATGMSSAHLYDNIIRFIVKYTKCHQGGMFILNDDEESKKYLELVACYAFERKKYLQKKIDIGDGLVGQCFLEGERTYLKKVPDEYVSITSGLGGTKPSSLLIIPMKVNEKTFGVIELASFSEFQDYEIDLLEKLAESVASTISNVRVNDTTRILLEKTQQQAEEMKSQEEEIRQNMEELEATQEEMRRKQDILERELVQSQEQAEVLRLQEKKLMESQDTLQAIVDNIPRAIFWKDSELRFMGCNIIFAQVAGVSNPRDLIGKTDFDMAWSAQADAYRKDDMEVMRSRKAKLDIEEVNINSEGEESWVKTSKVPIISQGGDVVAILGMFEDITAWKRKEADVAQKLKERDAALQELTALKQLLELKKA